MSAINTSAMEWSVPHVTRDRRERFFRLQLVRAVGLPLDDDKQRAIEALAVFCMAAGEADEQHRYDLVRLALVAGNRPEAGRGDLVPLALAAGDRSEGGWIVLAGRVFGQASEAARFVADGRVEPAA
jgi:hypothetical protein